MEVGAFVYVDKTWMWRWAQRVNLDRVATHLEKSLDLAGTCPDLENAGSFKTWNLMQMVVYFAKLGPKTRLRLSYFNFITMEIL